MAGTLSIDDVLKIMRVQHADFSQSHLYQVGCFDTKVTIHAQQLRAFNLAWALQASGVVHDRSRVAIIGGGAAGLSLVAGLYVTDCHPVLFERRETWMHLQRANSTRWLHPNIYEWPKEPLENRTFDLPDLKWNPNLSFKVVDQILNAFDKYKPHFEPRTSTKVSSIKESSGSLQISSENADAAEIFDVVILSVGFGLEEEFAGITPLSYWSNDDISGGVQDDPNSPYSLIVGCGDGGLTDAIRLSCLGFRHEQLQRLAEMPDLQALGRKLVEAERRTTSDSERNEIYATAKCVGSVIDYFDRSFRKRNKPVKLTDRSGFLYKENASVLNRLLVRHLVHWQAIEWLPFQEIASGNPPRIDKSKLPPKVHAVARTGPVGAIQDLCKEIKKVVDPRGYSLGTEAHFPKGFFRFPLPTKETKKLLIFAAGAQRFRGGGTARELAQIEQLLKTETEYSIEYWPEAFQPHFYKYRALLDTAKQLVADYKPDMILVMASDLFPILTTDAVTYKYPRLRFLLPLLRVWTSLQDIAQGIPIVYFGAYLPFDKERIEADRDVYYVQQSVEDAEFFYNLQKGFAGKTVFFIMNPSYLLDFFFWDRLKKLHKKLRTQGKITFEFKLKIVWDESPRTVAVLIRNYNSFRRRQHEQCVYTGRMTIHILGKESHLMRRVPCVSSYHEDLGSGAMIAYDNHSVSCAETLVEKFIVPILRGQRPQTQHHTVKDRDLRGSMDNIKRHGFRIGEALMDHIAEWE